MNRFWYKHFELLRCYFPLTLSFDLLNSHYTSQKVLLNTYSKNTIKFHLQNTLNFFLESVSLYNNMTLF